jgi:glycosyltransferase involved in cell wall biosynthesis
LFDLVRAPHADPRVMFLGNLSVPHNIDAAEYSAREIWPRVTAAGARGRLLLAGADPTPAVRRLARPGVVEVTGRVPDLTDLWRSVHVLLAPLRFSTGIQNKVLEAMAAGVPVVTTPPVAEAIGARGGEHLLIAADTAGLAAAVDATLRDPSGANARAALAREHVRAHFSWDTPVRRLEQLVDARTGGSGSAAPSPVTLARG